VFGRFNGDLESSLRSYDNRFVKSSGQVFGTEYSLFVREDPFYLCVYGIGLTLARGFASVIAVSYDPDLTERLVGGVVGKLGLKIFKKPDGGWKELGELGGLADLMQKDLLRMKIKRFSELVSS